MTNKTRTILKKIEKEPEFFTNVTATMGDAICMLLLETDAEFNFNTKNIITNLAQKRLELRRFNFE